MTFDSLKTFALKVRAPIAWMLVGILLFASYGHWKDHGEFHTMVRWVNKADGEIVALKKAIVAPEKRPVTP
jgi:hypothetical protein